MKDPLFLEPFRFNKETGLSIKKDNQRFTTVRFDSLVSVKKFGMYTCENKKHKFSPWWAHAIDLISEIGTRLTMWTC